MPENNSVCAICGEPYYLCLSCKDQMELSPWKIHTDTSEHYKVYQILRGYNLGIYTKVQANKKLSNIDLSDINNFKDNIKEQINEIMASVTVKDEDTKVDTVDTNLDIVETKNKETEVIENTDTQPIKKTEKKSVKNKSVNSEQ
jgi:hypothetical protein